MKRIQRILQVLLLAAPMFASATPLEDLLIKKGVVTPAEIEALKVEAAATEKKEPVVSWKNGVKVDFPSEGISTSLSALVVQSYTYEDDNGDKSSSFETQAARIALGGSVLDKKFSYVVEGDFVGDSAAGKNTSNLKNGYIQWNPTNDSNVRLGQYKTFISRQFNTTIWKTQFADRTEMSQFFELGYQQGISGSVASEGEVLQFKAGLFNGESDGEGINRPGVDTKHTGIFSVRYNPLAQIDAYSESDVEYSEDLGITFGAAYALSSNESEVEGGGTTSFDKDTYNADMMAKVKGFSLAAEFLGSSEDTTAGSESVDPTAFYVQSGYFFVPKKFEIAARYGQLDCDSGKAGDICEGNDTVDEYGVSLNYYFKGHNLKTSVGYTHLTSDAMDGGAEIDADIVKAQASVFF